MRPAALAFIALTIVVLAGTFYWFQSHQQLFDGKEPAQNPIGNSSAAVDETNTPLQRVQIVIANGERVNGPAVIRLKQGDELQLEFRSDQDGELHIHGYDISVDLKAGGLTSIFFKATYSGHFEYELHGHHHGDDHGALGAIEVTPN